MIFSHPPTLLDCGLRGGLLRSHAKRVCVELVLKRVPRVEEDYPRVHVRRTSRRGVSLPNEALDHSTFSHRSAADSGLAS